MRARIAARNAYALCDTVGRTQLPGGRIGIAVELTHAAHLIGTFSPLVLQAVRRFQMIFIAPDASVVQR